MADVKPILLRNVERSAEHKGGRINWHRLGAVNAGDGGDRYEKAKALRIGGASVT
jgi:hypothetical protein